MATTSPNNKRISRFFFLPSSLLALYTVAITLASNIDQVPPAMILRSLIVTQIIAALAIFACQVIVRDWELAGSISFFMLAIGLNYGHFVNVSQRSPVILWMLWVALILILSILVGFVLHRSIWERIRAEFNLLRLLISVVMLLLIFPGYVIGLRILYILKDSQALAHFRQEIDVEPVKLAGTTQPDIYYLIVDGYGRADVLQTIYQFDNAEFLSFLQSRGFYIADNSHSNYIQTTLSLSSSLNFTYLDELTNLMGPRSNDRAVLENLIQDNRVVETFRKKGYRIVTLYSGFLYTNFQKADIYLSPFMDINEYEGLLLHASILRDVLGKNSRIPIYGYQSHRQIVNFNLDTIGDTAKIPGPKFVFAHILAPHPPFVFSEEGTAITPNGPYTLSDGNSFHGTRQDYLSGYAGQLTYLNLKLKKTIDAILNNSSYPPIILLQADHGPGFLLDWQYLEKTCLRERTSILNAYYLPGIEAGTVYPEISPVNSFRLVFNRYFNQKLEILPDRVYYSSWDEPYRFVDVTTRQTEIEICQK